MDFGLSKLAAEDIIEQNTPETSTSEDEKETIITCLSDCVYCQNPEKTCMLSNVTISMDANKSFMCGQYKGTEQEQTEQMGQTEQMAQAAPANTEMGLSKTKKPEAALQEAPQETPQKQPEMGLKKVKKMEDQDVPPVQPEQGLKKVKKPITEGES